MTRRRGFTLVELMVYLALVTAGVLTLLSIEMGAHRALALQEALIAIDLESATLLGALRVDVEASRRLAVDEDALVVERFDGRTVRYEAGARIESGGGAPERRTVYATNSASPACTRCSHEGPNTKAASAGAPARRTPSTPGTRRMSCGAAYRPRRRFGQLLGLP